MTGLEKIIDKINADSERDCASVIAAAYKKSETLEKEAEAARAQMIKSILDDAEQQAKEIAERGESTAHQIKRQTLLKAKIEMVNVVTDKALAEIKSLDDKDYFDILLKLAVGNARAGKGVMYLSDRDLKRLPDDFIGAVLSRLEPGCELILSAKSADIDGGFILVYGDIDVNCTFDALIEDRRDTLKERICAIIFD